MSSIPPLVFLSHSVLANQVKHDLLVAFNVLRAGDNFAFKNEGLGGSKPDLLQHRQVVENLVSLLSVQRRHGYVGGQASVEDPVGVEVTRAGCIDRFGWTAHFMEGFADR